MCMYLGECRKEALSRRLIAEFLVVLAGTGLLKAVKICGATPSMPESLRP